VNHEAWEHEVIMRASSADAAESRRVRQFIEGDFVWFRLDGTAYITQDRPTMERIGELFAPPDDFEPGFDDIAALRIYKSGGSRQPAFF
jgi:hypothetical protein